MHFNPFRQTGTFPLEKLSHPAGKSLQIDQAIPENLIDLSGVDAKVIMYQDIAESTHRGNPLGKGGRKELHAP
jgi:hypothetical protein